MIHCFLSVISILQWRNGIGGRRCVGSFVGQSCLGGTVDLMRLRAGKRAAKWRTMTISKIAGYSWGRFGNRTSPVRMLDSDIWRAPKNTLHRSRPFFQIDRTFVIRIASIAPVESVLQVRKWSVLPCSKVLCKYRAKIKELGLCRLRVQASIPA